MTNTFCTCPHHRCLNVNDIGDNGLCYDCETERLVRMTDDEFAQHYVDLERRLQDAGMPSLRAVIDRLAKDR